MEDEDHLFNDLKSCDAFESNFIVDNYLDIDFVVCTNESRALIDHFGKFVYGNHNFVEDKDEKNKESDIHNVPFQRAKLSNQMLDTQQN